MLERWCVVGHSQVKATATTLVGLSFFGVEQSPLRAEDGNTHRQKVPIEMSAVPSIGRIDAPFWRITAPLCHTCPSLRRARPCSR